MLLLQALVFSINRKERNSVRPLAVAAQRGNCAACCSRGRRLNVVWFCLFTALLTHLAFRKSGSQICVMNLCRKALRLDKAMDFSVKSKKSHGVCSANHAEGHKNCRDAFEAKGIGNLQRTAWVMVILTEEMWLERSQMYSAKPCTENQLHYVAVSLK